MTPPAQSTAKSARRTIAMTLLSVLLLAGTASYVVAAGNPDFSLSNSPNAIIVTKGGAATFSLILARQNGFDEAVDLTLSGVPAATTATFSPSARIPATGSSATLKLQTSAATPAGSHRITVTATGGRNKQVRSTFFTLTVNAPGQPDYSITPSPASRTVPQSDDAVYTIAISRTNFTGPVTLTPIPVVGVTATITPAQTTGTTATLTVSTTDKTKPGTYDVGIQASAGPGPRAAAVKTLVESNKPFTITGHLAGSLQPGVSRELDLVLGNPHNFPIRVSSLSVAIEEQTSEPGCSGTDNFTVRQPGGLPYTVPAKSTRPLSQLAVPPANRPRIAMADLASNQDACKGAAITLQYAGTATK